MKVCFKTFGCRLNKAEALQMEADYLADGWELTTRESDADLFVVRGCSVTAAAQHESEKLIAHLRHTYPTIPIRICGCLKEKGEATSSSLQRNWTGSPIRSDEDVASPLSKPLPSRTARAYLKVQDGCSGRCTFCIVPTFRGPSRSVPFSDVLDTARRFLDAGYHELVITGCNLSLYASNGKRLPELMEALADLTSHGRSDTEPIPPYRIRLGSLEPGTCARDVVACMAAHANICRFLHLPIQSGSDRILTAMNRPYRIGDIVDLVGEATRQMPQLGLGCDLMTGFPGETDADFAATKNLLERLPFSNAHVFPYSERTGTPAVEFPDSVPVSVRSRRATELSVLAREKRDRFAQTFIGQTVGIVVEDRNRTVGWTGEYLRCEAEGRSDRKSLVKIAVTDVVKGRLRGRVVTGS